MRWLGMVWAASCFIAMPVAASPQSEAYVQTLVDELQLVPTGREADFIIDQVDMMRLSRFVLGRHGREITPDDFARFSSRLDRFLRNFLSERSEELGSAHIEIISSIDRSETDSIIATRVWSPAREPMIMRWRVINRDGEWRLVDFEIHGLWLAIEQRAQISTALSRGGSGIDELYL